MLWDWSHLIWDTQRYLRENKSERSGQRQVKCPTQQKARSRASVPFSIVVNWSGQGHTCQTLARRLPVLAIWWLSICANLPNRKKVTYDAGAKYFLKNIFKALKRGQKVKSKHWENWDSFSPKSNGGRTNLGFGFAKDWSWDQGLKEESNGPLLYNMTPKS